MSRTILWILTVFLSLAMLALIGVQAYWFRSSIDAKEEQLGLVVNQVLGEISSELVQDKTVMTILEELSPPAVSHQSQAVWNFHIDGRSTVVEPNPAEGRVEEEMHEENATDSKAALTKKKDIPEDMGIHEDIRITGEFRYGEIDAARLEEVPRGNEVIVSAVPTPSLKNQKIQIIDDSLLVILGEDELLQDTILITALNPDQVRSELIKSWKEQELFVDRIVRQMLVDGEPLEDRITGSQVKKLLTAKLREKGVEMPFEYAVYEEGKKPIYQSEYFNEFEDCKYYRAPLIRGSVFQKSTLISVFFPEERKHFIKSMGILGGTSALITLFVLSLFSLALFIIFKQKRLSEMKNDFVNNMTHELKTPISTISLASQMLNDKSIPEEQKNLAQISRIIQTESKQLGFQVERVLQMAIFDHGELKLKLEKINLHEIIETVAQNFLLQIDRRGGKLEFSPEAENDVIQGDAMHITNVVSNLIENAIKYTRQTPAIGIATHNEQGKIVISVSDNGIGISKEDQKRIFDKFYRVPTGNVHNVKGFGLGLSYVKLIVDHHHGVIKIKSETGKGSRFDIHLPLLESSYNPNRK
ncbi:MAG: HAMP domain-containing sensor histidine kinase [Bacteroidota bacterium]